MQNPLKVECSEAFPQGVGIVGAVKPQFDFNRSTKDRKVQELDKESGLPMWVVDVMDFDPDARERTFRVKIAASHQPVPPNAVEGAPVRPVLLEGLTISPYVASAGKDKNGQEKFKVAFSLRATGLAAPRGVRSVGDASKAA